MSELFEGYPVGEVRHVEVADVAVGPGGHAQLVDVTFIVTMRSGERLTQTLHYGHEGPTLAQVHATIDQLNKMLSQMTDDPDE